MTEDRHPDAPVDAGDETAERPGGDAGAIVESAAEIGVGAVIAPFTGGDTVPIVESIVSIVEAGVDRLTHLGDRHPDEGAAHDGSVDDGSVDDGSMDGPPVDPPDRPATGA